MYRCYHLRPAISKKRSEYLLRCYTAYAGYTLILLFFVTIAYDWRTGMGKYTILENGHCSFVDPSSYNTFFLYSFIAIINRFLQITMLSAYFVYLYKLNINVLTAQVTLDVRHSCKLFRIATGSHHWFFVFHLILCCIHSRIFRNYYQHYWPLNSSNRWRL